MTFDMVFVLGLTLAALVLFALDKVRVDQVALAVPVVLLLSGILTPAEAVSGLSSRATVTVGSMLVLGLGLRKTGLVSAIGAWARTAPLGGKYARMFALCLICALLSPFLMTTAVVLVFLPVFVALAEQAEEPASRYLMPLSFVSILGGTVTLMDHHQPRRARRTGGERRRPVRSAWPVGGVGRPRRHQRRALGACP